MRSGDYAETRAVIELSAAQGPGPTYLLDITDSLSARPSVQELMLNTHAGTELQR